MHEEITIPELTEVVARVTALLGPREGSVVQLEGGITNRNFRVNFGGTDYVVRLPGKRTEILGIDRTAECIANKAAAEAGHGSRRGRDVRGAALPRDAVHRRPRDERRGAAQAGGARRDRRATCAASTSREPSCRRASTRSGSWRSTRRAAASTTPSRPRATTTRSRSPHRIEKAVRDQPTHERVPAHNDLLTANFLLDGDSVQLIDWEYAGMGDRWFDLGNFAVNNELDDEQEAQLLEAYFGEPPDERLTATLKLFRFMSDFREAMWGVVQRGVSELDFDYGEYTRKHFDRLEEARQDPRFDGWIEAARA